LIFIINEKTNVGSSAGEVSEGNHDHDTRYLRKDQNDTTNFTITATNFIDASDRRLKQKFKKFVSSEFGEINFIQYELKSKSGIKQYGVVADEIIKIYPELVYKGYDGMLGVDYRGLSVIGMQKVQELERLLNTSIWKLIWLKFKIWING